MLFRAFHLRRRLGRSTARSKTSSSNLDAQKLAHAPKAWTGFDPSTPSLSQHTLHARDAGPLRFMPLHDVDPKGVPRDRPLRRTRASSSSSPTTPSPSTTPAVPPDSSVCEYPGDPPLEWLGFSDDLLFSMQIRGLILNAPGVRAEPDQSVIDFTEDQRKVSRSRHRQHACVSFEHVS